MISINQVKGHLARILATENIHIRHDPSAETASFDVKGRVLSLPVWKNISLDLYDMLIVHEVGHALDTPADGWMSAIKDIVERAYGKRNVAAEMAVKDFLNVIEDARIDKRQKRRFPGAKRNYIVGLKELYKNDFFGLSGREVNDLSFIDRANLYFKGGSTLLNIKFSDEERKYIRRMENLETFEEVIALTEEVFKFAKDKGEQKLETIRGLVIAEMGEEGDEDGEGFSDDLDDLDMFLEGDDEDGFNLEDGEEGNGQGLRARARMNDDEDGEGKDGDPHDGDAESSDKSKNNSKTDSTEGGENEGNDAFVPDVTTEQAARNNIKNFIQNENVEFIEANIPAFNLDHIVEDFSVIVPRFEKEVGRGYGRYSYYSRGPTLSVEESKKQFNEWKNKERDTISFMVKEFEMRKSASAYSRVSVSKTGILDPNKLHSYKFNEDVFRRVSVIPKGKNHGFVMFVDWSGSMEYQLKETIKQLLSLVMFCKKVGIPFEVYYFRSAKDADFIPGGSVNSGYGVRGFEKQQMSQNEGDMRFDTFKLCNILSSRMNHAMFNRAALAFWMAGDFQLRQETLWSTPLNQAILAADQVVNNFRRRNKTEIVSTIFLTDGGSDSPNGIVKEDTKRTAYDPLVPRKTQRYIVTDPITKRSFFFNRNPSWSGKDFTRTALEILKERTGTNLIGFYITPHNTMLKVANELDQPDLNTEERNTFYKKNGFVPVKTSGYDDYYVINAKKLAIVYDEELKVDSNMTKRKLTSEFIKFNNRKSVNRILLSSFIGHVAGEDKKKAA